MFTPVEITSGIICAGLALATMMVIHAWRTRETPDTLPKSEEVPADPKFNTDSIFIQPVVCEDPTLQTFIDELPTSATNMAKLRKLPLKDWPELSELVNKVCQQLADKTLERHRAIPRIELWIQRKVGDFRRTGGNK